MTPFSHRPPPGAGRSAAIAAMMLAAALLPAVVRAQSPEVRIEGADAPLANNIRSHLNVTDERCDAPLRRLERLLPQIRRNVERAAQALGYYHLEKQIRFDTGEDCWSLLIEVSPSEPVTIGEIDVSIGGDARHLFTEVIEDSPVRRGARLNHAQYEQFKTGLSTVAIENGYFDARFSRSLLRVDPDTNRASIIIDFDPGTRYRFGEVHIEEMEALSRDFVRRFVPFEGGDPYSSDQLAQLRENLNGSQYFSQVAVTPQVSRTDSARVPVNVTLAPRPQRSYLTGVGISTDAGPRLRFAYEDRYVNRRGHQVNADLTLSTQQQEPAISYIIPLRDPARESLRISGGFLREETESYESNAYRVGVSYRTNVANNWVQNIFTNFQHENALLNGGQREQTNSTISGINWGRTRSDDPIYPTRGWRLFGEISGAHEALLSDISFLQVYGSAEFIRSAGPGRILLRGEAASTLVDEAVDLPVSERFFTGGDQSVRGYAWGELGERNAEGDVVGGRNLLVGSVEYDFPVYNRWHGAVFYDIGNSFDNVGDMQLRDSVGIGVRWLSPIGAIRADIARELADGRFRFHLTMGPDL